MGRYNQEDYQRIEEWLINLATIIAIIIIISAINLRGGDIIFEYGTGTNIDYAVDIGYTGEKVMLKLGCQYGASDEQEIVLYNAYLGKSLNLTDKTRITLNSVIGYCDIYNDANYSEYAPGYAPAKRESHFNYGAELIAIVNINPKFGVIGGFEYTEYGGFLFKVGIAL